LSITSTFYTARMAVWILALEESVPSVAIACLSSEELLRSSRYIREADRVAFLATRAALRLLVGAAVHVAPADIQLISAPSGKPLLAPCHRRADVRFSLSHTDGFSAVAISTRGPIGVDIERRRAVPDRIRIASWIFGAHVGQRLAQRPAEQQDEIFLQLWTSAEAYMKATGRGLGEIQERVPLSLSASGAVLLDAQSDKLCSADWMLIPVQPLSDCVATVAVGGHFAPSEVADCHVATTTLSSLFVACS
jgi:4'-phosphopantetheinyl transferase